MLRDLFGLILAIRIGKRVWRRMHEWRYWAYLGAVTVASYVGRDLSVVITANQRHAQLIEEVTNGVILFALLGFSVAWFATTPPPTEGEVLRKIARRKLNEAMVDGSEGEARLMFWSKILEGPTDEL
ncbi:MAG TPA: hypothetical protein V6D06_18785 [Trichocoleus sp.]